MEVELSSILQQDFPPPPPPPPSTPDTSWRLCTSSCDQSDRFWETMHLWITATVALCVICIPLALFIIRIRRRMMLRGLKVSANAYVLADPRLNCVSKNINNVSQVCHGNQVCDLSNLCHDTKERKRWSETRYTRTPPSTSLRLQQRVLWIDAKPFVLVTSTDDRDVHHVYEEIQESHLSFGHPNQIHNADHISKENRETMLTSHSTLIRDKSLLVSLDEHEARHGVEQLHALPSAEPPTTSNNNNSTPNVTFNRTFNNETFSNPSNTYYCNETATFTSPLTFSNNASLNTCSGSNLSGTTASTNPGACIGNRLFV